MPSRNDLLAALTAPRSGRVVAWMADLFFHRPVLVAAACALLATPGLARAEAPVLSLPMDCTVGKTCAVQHYVDHDPGPGVLDYRGQHRTYDGHDGMDLRLMTMAAQRAGVAVLAAAPGRVARLRDGVADISIRATGAPSVAGQECGNGLVIAHGDGWETQYCHLARGSLAVKVGDMVARGQPVGRVGLSGNTEFPHLHLTVRHGTSVVDPFAPGPGVGPPGLWDLAASRALAYRAGEVLNMGWADKPVTEAAIDSGALAAPTAASAVLAPYVRLIGLAAGDVIEFSLTGPAGTRLAQVRLPPLDRDKDSYWTFIGHRMPAGGWTRGRYAAEVRVLRAGAAVLDRRIETTL